MAVDEKIRQNPSLDRLLAQFGFNPFTPFPELSRTTAKPGTNPWKNRTTKTRKIKKFPVFVAVEPSTSSTKTVLPAFVEADKHVKTIEKKKVVVHEKFSQLSDKQWIESIRRRTTKTPRKDVTEKSFKANKTKSSFSPLALSLFHQRQSQQNQQSQVFLRESQNLPFEKVQQQIFNSLNSNYQTSF